MTTNPTGFELSAFSIVQLFKLRVAGVIHIGSLASADIEGYRKIGAIEVLLIDPAQMDIINGERNNFPTSWSVKHYPKLQSGNAIPNNSFFHADMSGAKSRNLRDIVKSNGFNNSEFSYFFIDGSVISSDAILFFLNECAFIDAIHIRYTDNISDETTDVFTSQLLRKNFKKAIFPVGTDTRDILFVREFARTINRRSSEPTAYRVPRNATKPESIYLLNHRRTVTSQLGEDGILSKVFEVLGISNGLAVELAAGDGVKFSNCWTLWNEKEWQAVLVDSDPLNVNKLRALSIERENVRFISAHDYLQGYLSLDEMLSNLGVTSSYDFLSIDVRGNEWAVWDAHFLYRPKVVCVAFNPSFSNSDYYVQSQSESVSHGSSLLAFETLGKRKGYELVAATAWNAIFVSAESFYKFNIADNSLDAMYAEQAEFVHSFYQLYDGTIGIIGKGRHMWRACDIDLSAALPASTAVGTSARLPNYVSDAEFDRLRNAPAIYLTPTGGLVNRLMACVSSLRLADLFQRKLYIEWTQTHSLTCPWEKLFSTPIPSFEAAEQRHVKHYHRFNLDASVMNPLFRVRPVLDLNNATDDISVISNCFIGHTHEGRGNAFWNYTRSAADVGKYFSQFEPSDEVQHLVDLVLNDNQDFANVIGLHVRRGVGDNPDARAKFNAVTDEDYVRVIAQINNTDARVFVATDSQQAREKLASILGNKAIFYSARSYAKHEAPEAIQDALVEFLLLSRCEALIGNKHSTFAYFASQVNLTPYYEVSRSTAGNIDVCKHSYRDATGNFHISEVRWHV